MRRFGIAAGLVLTFLAGCASTTEGSITGPDQEVVNDGDDAPAPAAAAAQPPPKKVHVLANIGDSISQAMDADDSVPVDVDRIASDPDAVFHDFTALSWIQGDDDRVSSVAEHYRKLDPTLVVKPFSVSGAEMVGKPLNRPTLVDQATQLVESGTHPDLLFVLLGGNDVCNRPKAASNVASTSQLYPVAKWVEQIDKGLTIIANGLDAGAKVRVLSMPRVDRLYESAGDSKFSARYGSVNTSLSCKQFWSATNMMGKGVCPIVTTETDPARRAAIGQRIDEYNDALAAEVRRFSTDRTVNPKGIVFESDWHGPVGKGGTVNGSMGTFAFDANLVSKRDCFHPSVDGQAAVAKMVLETADWE